MEEVAPDPSHQRPPFTLPSFRLSVWKAIVILQAAATTFSLIFQGFIGQVADEPLERGAVTAAQSRTRLILEAGFLNWERGSRTQELGAFGTETWPRPKVVYGSAT